MTKTKRKTIFIWLSIFILLFSVGLLFMPTYSSAQADGIVSVDRYNFTLITDGDGNQSYSVAIKAAAKPSAETVIIPNVYNGLPVTEIANNGFMTCANLKRVVLPNTIKKIGNNAFMNCVELERINLPAVENIGMNAFALCPLLDRTYIPNTVKTMGANVFRNNSNSVYIQNSLEQVGAQWQSTWSDYFTGDIFYDIAPADMVKYREILDANGTTVGYEVAEDAIIWDVDADIVIYNSFRGDENSEYLPVLNICSEAFTYSVINSLTIKDRCIDEPAAPEFTHKINIRSNAFLALSCNEVIFDGVGITFDHPQDLQNTYNSLYDDSPIVGDENNHSIKIFEDSSIQSITLPADIDFIPQRMFYNCSYIKNIRIAGQEYDGNNILPAIDSIGAEAFSSCVGLSNLTIPDTVEYVGSDVFVDWGSYGYIQEIDINFYEELLPQGWSVNWLGNIAESLTVNYKPKTVVQIDWCDEVGTKSDIEVMPGLGMPAIEMPVRNGYAFKGIYSEMNGNGFQYYTNNVVANRIWQEGDPITLYADWEIEIYNIIYPDEIKDIVASYPKTYTVLDEFEIPNLVHNGYEYKFTPRKIKNGTYGDLQIEYTKEIINYKIIYSIDNPTEISNPNPTGYTVEDEIVFESLVCEGYTFAWSPTGIAKGSTGDIDVFGIWTPIQYKINYIHNITSDIYKNTDNPNPDTYTYGQTLVLQPAVRGGYFVAWDKTTIPAGTIGDVTVTANYTEKTLAQCYNNGVYEIWTLSQLKQFAAEPNGGYGRKYRLMESVSSGPSYTSNTEWTPIPEFRGELDGNGYDIDTFSLKVTSGGNWGFCKVNSGTIKNLTLRFGFSVGEEYSNVSIGAFAGVNKGTISNCGVTIAFVRPGFKCYAKGDSYMGCIVGTNEGTIENCNQVDDLQGSCNMGLIAGKNSGTIRNCNLSNRNIYFDYMDYNACIGGIVGLQIDGSVENCKFNGSIQLYNYRSDKYNSQLKDRELQPCIGIIIGRWQGGTTFANTWERLSYAEEIIQQKYGQFAVVTWTEGSGSKQVTYTHDQGLYVKNEECGRIG